MSLFKILNSLLSSNLDKAGIREHSSHYLFVKDITESSRVIDLGANRGHFFSLMVQRYDCFCHAVEASPDLFNALPVYPKVTCYNYAISNTNGPLTFYLSTNSEANSLESTIADEWSATGSVVVTGRTFKSFLKENEIRLPADVLKIDIEGAELDALESLPDELLAAFGQIAVEFHDFILKSPEYNRRMHQIIRRLRKHYHVVKVSNTDWSEVTCINRTLQVMTVSEKLRLKVIHPWLQALKSAHIRFRKFRKSLRS